MKRVVLSTKLMIGEGSFRAIKISQEEALEWLAKGPFDNYCGHQTVKLLGLDPDEARGNCTYYDEALSVTAIKRLKLAKEYSLEEIQAIGVEYILARRIVTIEDLIGLAAQLPSGLNDHESPGKLYDELLELMDMITKGDLLGARLEAADVAYYCAKVIDYVSNLVILTPGQVMSAAQAKYALRAQHGNPKDDAVEREALLKLLGGEHAETKLPETQA